MILLYPSKEVVTYLAAFFLQDYQGTYVSVIMKVLDRIDAGRRRSCTLDRYTIAHADRELPETAALLQFLSHRTLCDC